MFQNSIYSKHVYFAGPDVFKPNALDIGQRYVSLAQERGFVGLFPLDNKVDISAPNADKVIYDLNRNLIHRADILVVNLEDFRGFEPDSGTVWELAYAFALNKIIVGYIPTSESMVQRIAKTQGVVHMDTGVTDLQGNYIENFGQPINLMLKNSLTALVVGNVADALDKALELVSGSQAVIPYSVVN